MTSLEQIEANRRNARLSTGPVSEEGKIRSRQNAVRHGLTAETVIDALEDAEDYAKFEMAVTADYDAPSAVERELVLRLASLLWRLRRATAIESGLCFGSRRNNCFSPGNGDKATGDAREALDSMFRNTVPTEEVPKDRDELIGKAEVGSLSTLEPADQFDDLTRSFVRLSNLPTYPLDRLSRYEATLWRQACQVLFTIEYLERRKPYGRLNLRMR